MAHYDEVHEPRRRQRRIVMQDIIGVMILITKFKSKRNCNCIYPYDYLELTPRRQINNLP